MAELIDLTGKKFGNLTVISKVDKPSGLSNTRAQWLCVCSCGTTVRVEGPSLRNGPTKSCGCLRTEMIRESKITHGQCVKGSRSAAYNSWSQMIARCTNHNSTHYRHYGGRGIKVCERWKKFQNFYEDMGDCPKGLSIDRINNDGNYEPDNCRWATIYEQSNNKRTNRLITWKDKNYTAKQLSDFLNIPYQWFYDRAVRQKTPIDQIIAIHRQRISL